jgi:hypothetical protein
MACAFIKPIHCRFVNHVAAESVYEMLRVGGLLQSSQDVGPLAHRLLRFRFAARGLFRHRVLMTARRRFAVGLSMHLSDEKIDVIGGAT